MRVPYSLFVTGLFVIALVLTAVTAWDIGVAHRDAKTRPQTERPVRHLIHTTIGEKKGDRMIGRRTFRFIELKGSPFCKDGEFIFGLCADPHQNIG